MWDDGMLLTLDQPHDGFAGYGCLSSDYIVRHCRWEDGYEWLLPGWGDHEHLGLVPISPSSSGFRFTGGYDAAEESDAVSAPVDQACPAHHPETVERWLMDTGCGADLVSQADADRCALASIRNGQSFLPSRLPMDAPSHGCTRN